MLLLSGMPGEVEAQTGIIRVEVGLTAGTRAAPNGGVTPYIIDPETLTIDTVGIAASGDCECFTTESEDTVLNGVQPFNYIQWVSGGTQLTSGEETRVHLQRLLARQCFPITTPNPLVCHLQATRMSTSTRRAPIAS